MSNPFISVNSNMKSLRHIFSNQAGMSMLFMVMIVSLAVGGIAFVTTDMIPKLQSEKKKAEAAISYRVFIGSLNDYLVHGIRERWCLNYNNGVSDLLLSNACSSSKAMEDIVTYPGNLERVLWSAENIGTTLTAPPTLEESNKILSLNYLRYHGNPQKTTKLLKFEDISPPDGKLTFKITQGVLNDMSEEHPLYVMAKKIKDCVNSINVEVFQVKDYNNVGGGDERKIGIHITSDIVKTRFSCMTLKQADSTSFYTFYPRRLHTFSLVKYGNLDGKLHNEFHGPVYVAGDFVLPPPSYDKNNATVFYNTLTLGIYNSGKNNGGIFRAGRIVNSDKSNYTFEDRGHPYLSKQDNYETFRGFLGGVHLDSSEDKGFHNLFDYTSTSSGDVSSLEACIEENNALLKPSNNADSILAYGNYSSSTDSARAKLSFTLRNRFKPSDEAGKANIDYTYGKKKKGKGEKEIEDFEEVEIVSATDKRFFFDVVSPEGNRALGNISFIYGKEEWNGPLESFYGTMGVDSQVEFGINLSYFNMTTSKLDTFISNVDSAKRYTYYNAIESGHALTSLSEWDEFKSKAYILKEKCDDFGNKASSDCETLGFSVNCDKSKDSSCDYSSQLSAYNQSKTNLKTRLEEVKQLIVNHPNPKMTMTLAHVDPYNGKTVLNQRYLDFSFPNEWRTFFKILRSQISKSIRITFTPYHYGPYNNLYMQFYLKGQEGNNLKFLNRADWDDDENLTMGGWRNTYNNELLSENPTPLVELDCPQGMGVADWDLDMSGSTNFAWNYANTPPGAQVDSTDHQPATPIVFHPGDGTLPPLEGHALSTTKSVVEECTIPADRTHVYGFYVCDKLIIKDRSTPLYMIGTFIVNELVQNPGANVPVHWHSIWDTKAADLIMTDLYANKAACDPSKNLLNKTWVDIINNQQVSSTISSCSPLDLVTNGPNNFSWTTVDPDVGIANPGDVMTSQKTNRIQKWIIREESRVDIIR